MRASSGAAPMELYDLSKAFCYKQSAPDGARNPSKRFALVISIEKRYFVVMNISLTPELERFVNLKVESRQYDSVTDVFREGLKLLVERDNEEKLVWLRAEIQKGIDEMEAGKYYSDEESMHKRRQRLLEMKKAQENN